MAKEDSTTQLSMDFKNWQLVDLPVCKLRISPMNLRARVEDEAHIEALADRINEDGYAPNRALIVNKREGEVSFRVVAGGNRLRAAILLGRLSVPCYLLKNLTDEEEARLGELDNRQDESHKATHFLDVAEAYRRLNDSGKTQQWIGDAYGTQKSHVSERIRIASIPMLAKSIIRWDVPHLSQLGEPIQKWVGEQKVPHGELFTERGLRDIIKLRRRRIIQICREIVEQKGKWKHGQIKRRVEQLQTIDDGLRIVYDVLEKTERKSLWNEVEKGFHTKLDELRALVAKLNAEYSRITLHNKDFFDLTDDEVPDSSIDLIYVDPPYGLSTGGITYHSGEIKSVNKGDWDANPPDVDDWVAICSRKLKQTGTIYVSGTFHNIYDVALSLRRHGFTIRNEIIWEKESASPTIMPGRYAFWHESLLFASKGDEYFFDTEQIKKFQDGSQMKDIWRISPPRGDERVGHPTQKPEALMERIITASCPVNGRILDPFSGSGTTLVTAKRLRREAVGYERNPEYVEMAQARLRS